MFHQSKAGLIFIKEKDLCWFQNGLSFNDWIRLSIQQSYSLVACSLEPVELTDHTNLDKVSYLERQCRIDVLLMA